MKAKFEYNDNPNHELHGWCFQIYDLTPDEERTVALYPERFKLFQEGIKDRPEAIERADGVCISIRNQPIYDAVNASFEVELPTQKFSPV